MTLSELVHFRPEILWWEICGLLHDIGKLSDLFLLYRQNWHRTQGAYFTDPHDHSWFDRDGLLSRAEFRELNAFFQPPIPIRERFLEGQLSVRNAVHNHTDPNDALTRLLKGGDAADSRYDRNYPLFGCEQTKYRVPGAPGDPDVELFRGNVFGCENRNRTLVQRGKFKPWRHDGDQEQLEAGALDRARRQLYLELQNLLLPYTAGRSPDSLCCHDYRAIRRLLRKYFEPAMADTARPNNDTSLWEHAYSVAAITKALHIQRLFGEDVDTRNASFRLWGFGWDALRYMSFSHRIGDLLGRREVLDRIFDRAEDMIEFEIPFGSRVYRDDNMLLFLVPDLADFETHARELQERIIETSVALSEGEIVPHFACSYEPVQSLTRIVEPIRYLQDHFHVPVACGAMELKNALARHWAISKARSVCSVCRMRPASREEENKLFCRICLERRRNRTRSFTLEGAPEQTPMVDEIADRNGRIALILAKFELGEWLDGSMVRTCFITEPDSIRKTLDAIDSFPDLRGSRTAFSAGKDHDYARIREEILACENGRNLEPAFLYFRDFKAEDPKIRLREGPHKEIKQICEDVLKDAANEYPANKVADRDKILVNFLCAKTPTPSTILDVWETTAEFLDGITEKRPRYGRNSGEAVIVEENSLLEDFAEEFRAEFDLGPRSRAYVEVEQETHNLHKNETFDKAEIDGSLSPVVCEGKDRRFWLVAKGEAKPEWNPKTLNLNADGNSGSILKIVKVDRKPSAYLPYRRISSSPQMLLLLVPAECAVKLTLKIYERYLEEFGKAYGRLPFSIGNIFFPKHLPMFSVLDAARRMERNFRRLHRGPLLKGSADRELTDLNLNLGNGCDPDFHHPYVLTEGAPSAKNTYFETMAGPVVHMSEAAGESVLLRPNWYDCEFLGASADRFRLFLKRPPESQQTAITREEFTGITGRGEIGEGPVLLDELQRDIEPLWEQCLKSKITDTRLRNFEQTLIARYTSWYNADPAKAKQGIRELAASLAVGYFKAPERDRVLRAIDSGFFFPTLNLYLRILKQRTEKGVVVHGIAATNVSG